MTVFRPEIVTKSTIINSPANATVLDLSGKGLWKMQLSVLTEIFAVIPNKFTTLNLEYNQLLYKKPIDDLVQLIRSIPSSINTIVFSGNNLFALELEEQRKIYAAFPNTIKTISSSDSDTNAMIRHGWYLNFQVNTYVRHMDLNQVQIRKSLDNFCKIFLGGQVREPLLLCLSKFLTSKDFANLRLVCKNGTTYPPRPIADPGNKLTQRSKVKHNYCNIM